MKIKALQTRDKCQDIADRTGERCKQTAKAVVIHRDLSSETRKKLCKNHAYDVLIRHCAELQRENEELKQQNADLLNHAPAVIQKIHDRVY